MRSYSDVVSASGKLICTVFSRYLFGVHCDCLRAILPNHVQSFTSVGFIGVRVRVVM